MSKSNTQIAREALLAMASDGVTPTPKNYKTYYEKVSGEIEYEPSIEALKNIKLKIRGDENLAEWKDAIDIALIKRDWLKLEELMISVIDSKKTVQNKKFVCKIESCNEKTALRNIIYVIESFTLNLEQIFHGNNVVTAQLDIIKDVIKEPNNKNKAYTAKRALSRLHTPEQLHSQLTEAKQLAKQLTFTFLKQMEVSGDTTEETLESLQSFTENVEKANTHEEILQLSKETITKLSSARDTIISQKDEMAKTLHQSKLMANKITDLETQVQVMSEAAKQDYLTGLMNRRGIEEEIEKIFKESWATISVALLDIDNFKKLNDTYGHKVGDHALKHLASVINANIRGKGTPARLGGEEFVIIFPGLDAEQTKEEMEKLQRALTKEIFMAEEDRKIVTFSAGVAKRENDETPEEILSRADEAMYVSKKTGKNKVTIAL